MAAHRVLLLATLALLGASCRDDGSPASAALASSTPAEPMRADGLEAAPVRPYELSGDVVTRYDG